MEPQSTPDLTKKTTPLDSMSSKIEEMECEIHGVTAHKIFSIGFGKEIKKCTLCAEFFMAEKEKRETERDEENRRQIIKARFERAAIAPRFADKTLDNFETANDGQREAVKAARWFLDNLSSGTPGLIFLGSNGTGKNHLSSAIVCEAIKKHGKTALITKVRKLDRAIKEAWRKDGLESETIKAFIDPHVLVIDEVGLQRGSETEMLHLAEVIDDRYEAMKPTILCGNLTLQELNGIIGDRAIDRFREGGRIVTFTWESYRRRAGKEVLTTGA